MPIDINLLRVDRGGDPEKVRASQKARFADVKLVDEILELDAIARKAKFDSEAANREKNQISNKVKVMKKESKGKADCSAEIAASKALDEKMTSLKTQATEAVALLEKKLNLIGNIVGPDVVISNTEDDNKVIRTWGEVNKDLVVDGKTLGKMHHHEIMQCLGILEMDRGQRVAGHRGYYLKGAGVLLNQALINYGLATLTKNGYTATQPPFFMRQKIMETTCQLSDFEENLYKVVGKEDDEIMYLTATAEQPISAMYMTEWIKPSELPKRFAGISTCFRKEAGSHGRDVWGIFRVHQFEKVEQFIYCEPDKSWEEFGRMVESSESFYQGLGLPYQLISIVSGELNDAAAQKYDLEAWFPGYNAFRELVSCSNCTDYQSRGLEVRYQAKPADEKQYVHMLNGTMCATERTMCCIMENYQTAEGVVVPEVLRPFMGGMELIPYDKEATAAFFEKRANEEAKEAAKAKSGKGKKQAEKKDAPKEKKPAAEPKKEEVKVEKANAAPAAPAKQEQPMCLLTNGPGNYFAQSSLAVADLAKVNVETRLVAQEERESKQYKDNHPLTMFPALEVNGSVIYDSQAISNYFARLGGKQNLLGSNPFEEAQVDSWNSFTATGVWGNAKRVRMAIGQMEAFKVDKFNAAVKGLKDQAAIVNKHLADGNAWLVGDNLTVADVNSFCSFIIPMQLVLDAEFRNTVPHFANWFTKMSSLPAIIGRLGHVKQCAFAIKFNAEGMPEFTRAQAAPVAAAKPVEKAAPAKEAAKAEEDDDDMDLFGDDDEDAAAAAAAAKEKVNAAKKPKKVIIQKSLILYEVKPWGEETDLDELAKMILAIEMDGLLWKTQYKKEPIAFGINKLLIGATVEDEKVSTDDLQEKIEAFEDHVQSVDIAAFNKV